MSREVGAPLALSTRSGEVESLHLGHLVVVPAEGPPLVTRGQPAQPIWVRSAAKPIQALPLWLSGAVEAFALPPACLAVAMASHSGEQVHRAAVAELLERAGLAVDQLGCGVHAPYHEPTARALALAGQAPDVLHCNCSGKHAGMLAVCKLMGWPIERYREPDHALQRWIRELLAGLSDVPAAAIGHGVDGCGVPVWRLPAIGLARAFARLAEPSRLAADLAAAARAAATVMAAHPQLVAGSGRLDTDLIAAGGGRLIAKIGGEAVHAGALLDAGLGWAIKVGDGNRRAIGPALARALELAGHPLPPLAAHFRPEVRNNHGELVGHVEAAW